MTKQATPKLMKKATNRQNVILIETRDATAITRLAFSSPLYLIANSFRVGVSIVQIIVLEFYHALK